MVLDRDPNADVRDLPGIAVRWADCTLPFWNCLALTEVHADAQLIEQRVQQAAEIMRRNNHPGFLWIFEDLLDEAARTALTATTERAGLEYAFPGTGMAGDLLPSPSRPIPN